MKQEQEKQNQQPPKMGYQTHIKVRETLTSQMRRDISPIHRRYRVENIARHFIRISKELVKEQEEYLIDRINRVNSSDLSDYKKNKIIQDLQQSLNEIRDKDTGPTVAVQTEGVNRVFNRVRSIYEDYINTPIEELIEQEKKNKYAVVIKRQEGNFEENLRKHAEYKIAEYKKVLKYFTPLMNEAYPEIESLSGISLSDTIAEDSQNEVDENGNPITDTDNEVGQAFKDGWTTKARYINPMSTLSKRIKAVLSEIPELGPRGNLLADDVGNARTMDSGKVYVILLTESHKLFDIEQFSTKDNPVLFFERLTAKYPWGKQIIRKLKNEDGSYNIPLISEFYTCLRMQFVPYFVSRDAFITATNIESGFQGTFDKTMTNIKRGYRLNKSMSIYTSDGKINRDVIGDLIILRKSIKNNLKSFDELTEDEVKELAKDLSKLTKAIGFEFEEKDALALLNDEERRINFLNGAFGDIGTIINGAYEHTEAILFADDYKNAYADVTYGLNIIGQEDLKTSFFNSGKQKYSYSYPNYTHKIVTKLSQRAYETAATKTGYSNMFNQTIEEEFKKDTIFFREGRFFNKWLDILSNSKEARSKFVHIQMDSIDGKDYTDWTTTDVYTMLNNAFENSNESSDKTYYQYAYYHMPILADSPAMMMIRAPKFTKNGYENDIIKALTDVVLSEMHRINRVKKRAELIRQGKLSPITNYDMILDKKTGKVKKIGGAEFKFFPELNNYQMKDGKFTDLVKEALDKGNKKKVNKLITEALTDIMERGYAEFEEEAGDYFDNPREYYYNSVLATTQIIQLTTSDLAFYKGAVDFQKRFKEVYAAGKRFNTNSELGKQNRRVAYLRDQYLPSRSLADIRNSLAKNSNLDNMAIDHIMTKFKRINVTDAQAYLSPKAYEIMIDMLGQLTPKAKAAFERFRESAEIVKNGGKPTWTAEDFSEIWQTFKPFMYTQIYHKSGIEGDESLIKTPLQHKNSEIMISTLFNLVAGPYSKSNKLNAMVKFMEKHDIDAFMFESAVKVGGHDFTDLNYSPSRLKRILKDGYARIGNNTIKSTKEVDGKIVNKSFEDFMEDASDLLLKGKITKADYQKFLDSFEPSEAEVTKMLEDSLLNKNGELDESRIDTVPYEDVMIAQENPEHLVDQKKATFGSQFANIIFSDFSPNNPIKLSDGTVLKSSEAKDLYNRLRVENIIKGYREAKEIVSDIDNLEEYLTNTINSNPSYSNDLLNAVKVVDYKNSKGEDVRGFNFPIHTPAMAKKLNQLIFSLFKNKVTKQFINGGNAVLVSDFGLTDSLEIEYDDKGNLAGIQCYLPAYSKEFFKPLMDENGHLDIEKLHKAGLDKVIGYRIPTEGKYSMVPLIIKGFLPQQNGSVIMLPSDITLISGSNFEIDRLFLILNNFYTSKKINRKAFKDAVFEIYSGNLDYEVKKQLSTMVDDFIFKLIHKEKIDEDSDSIENKLYRFFNINKEAFTIPVPKKVKYDLNKNPEVQSKQARDNMIIDLAFGALTSPEGAAQSSMPGNFDNLAHAADINRIVRDTNLIQELLSKTGNKRLLDKVINKSLEREDYIEIAEIILQADEDIVSKLSKKSKNNINPISPLTFALFHKASVIGGQAIGVYANSNTHFAKTQGTTLSTLTPINLFGREGNSISSVYNKEGQLISSTLAEYSAASVDDAKEHNLEPLNQNKDTFAITALLARRGYSPLEIGIYLGSNAFNLEYIPKAEVTTIVSKELILADTIAHTIEDTTILNTEEQISMVASNQGIKEGANALNQHIMMYRADSPNAALSHTGGGAAMQIIRREVFDDKVYDTLMYDKEGMLSTKEVKDNILNIDKIRELCMRSQTPMVAAFRALAIDSAEPLLSSNVLALSERMMKLLRNLTMSTPSLNITNEIAEKITSHYVIYRLSETKLFGDELYWPMEAKRKYYLEEFPGVFNNFLKSEKWAEFIKSNKFLNMIFVNEKKGTIEMPSPSDYNPDTVELIKSAALDLFTTTGGQKIAYSLLMYSYYHDGLQFRARSITPYITTTGYLEYFPELVSCLRNMTDSKRSDIENIQMTEFTNQLFNNIGIDFIAKKITHGWHGLNGVYNYPKGSGVILIRSNERNIENRKSITAPFIIIENKYTNKTNWYKLLYKEGEGKDYNAIYAPILARTTKNPTYKVGGGNDYIYS